MLWALMGMLWALHPPAKGCSQPCCLVLHRASSVCACTGLGLGADLPAPRSPELPSRHAAQLHLPSPGMRAHRCLAAAAAQRLPAAPAAAAAALLPPPSAPSCPSPSACPAVATAMDAPDSCSGFYMVHDVEGIRGLHLAAGAFSEPMERRLFEHASDSAAEQQFSAETFQVSRDAWSCWVRWVPAWDAAAHAALCMPH